MLKLRRQIIFLFNQAQFFSSSSSTTRTPTKPHFEFKTPQNQQQNHHQFLSLLLKNQQNRKTAQQIHSHLIITNINLNTNNLKLWNTLIKLYSLGDFPEEALMLYKYLQIQNPCFSSHFVFDSFTFLFLIKSCANLSCTKLGFQFQCLFLKLGYINHVYVQTALVDLYGVCGVLNEAKMVFDEMPVRNFVTWNVMISGLCKWGELRIARRLFDVMPVKTVVSWTVMIDGYTRINESIVAISLFRRMFVDEGIKPNAVTVLAIFPAISNIGDLRHCQCIHTYVDKNGFNLYDIRVTNSLVDSYAKCGCIKSASRFFDEISVNRRNIVSWTSIISAFAMHGMAREAVKHFENMEESSFKPNQVTFLSVLNACSHGGLVEQGLVFFKKMVDGYRVLPDVKHYGCLLDMLGRAGRLEEAEKMAGEVPLNVSNAVLWRTLLGACNHHGDVEMGERVTRKILEMEKEYGGDYVLMSNIFSGVGRFSDAETVRRLLDEVDAKKVPGISSV